MKEANTFQIVVIAIFMFLGIVGVVLFAVTKSGGSKDIPKVVMWGTLESMKDVLRNRELRLDKLVDITYIQQPKETFNERLVEAIATGKAPDLVLLPHETLLQQANKMLVIPFDSLTERTFRNTYIESGEVLLAPEGSIAFPLLIDPVVMYWNRTLFSSAGYSEPLVYWDKLPEVADKITKIDEANNIVKSAVAFGEYANVKNAKEVLSALLLQTGNPIVYQYKSTLDERFGNSTVPQTNSVLNFYTEYSNPVRSVYSWNRALPRSDIQFTKGDLGIYFGFASELEDIQNSNPNLNFDVAEFPQIRDGANITFGRVYGVAIIKQSKNIGAAYSALNIITAPNVAYALANHYNLPPARRDLLSISQNDLYMSAFYNSAIRSRAWHDFNFAATGGIFKDMIENVSTGKLKVSESIERADGLLNNILP